MHPLWDRISTIDGVKFCRYLDEGHSLSYLIVRRDEDADKSWEPIIVAIDDLLDRMMNPEEQE